MSPQDKVERVLKDIHVAFSRAEVYNQDPSKVLMDRREFLELLDRLNQGIYGMMDQYEQTRQSRNLAERAFKRKGDEIIEEANASAEDIYAASIIYTADMLNRIRDLMDQTNESMNDMFREFRKGLKEEKDLVRTHELELQNQLQELSESKKYLSLIREMNVRRDRRTWDAPDAKEGGRRSGDGMSYAAVSTTGVKVNEQYFEKTGTAKPGTADEELQAEKPEIHVNRDAEYFKWKSQQAQTQVSEIARETNEQLEAANPINENNPGLLSEEELDRVDAFLGIEGQEEAYPNEEAIRQAVLEDELAMEYKGELQSGIRAENKTGGKGLLRNIILGKD